MKATLIVGICVGIVNTSMAEQVLAEYDWSKLADTGTSLGGVPVVVDARTALK